jgi:integrase
MIRLHKRGQSYHIDYATPTHRLRGSLGTKSREASIRLKSRLENALAEGRDSGLWRELKPVLPKDTFERFSSYSGVRSEGKTWTALESIFRTHLDQRVQLGKMSPKTRDRYLTLVRRFSEFLAYKNLDELSDVTKAVVEEFKAKRMTDILAKKRSKSGGGLVLDVAILHRVFSLAVEHELLVKNPVKMEGVPGSNPRHGAEPFSPDELKALREHVGEDEFLFLLLRWTGLRGSDAVDLRWKQIDLEAGEINRLTQKRKKQVVIPIHKELREGLREANARQRPAPTDHVAINPATKKPMTRPVLYNRMVALGKRAGVPRVHPHRFRDTLAVDLLLKDGSFYDVAKILGDELATVEKHYTPFVKTLRDRVRVLLDNDKGLESR